MAGRRRERRAADRGAVSVMSVFFVLLLLVMLAVTINLGRLMRSKGDLQHATDTAVLAGVDSLDSKPDPGPEPGRYAADFDDTSTTSTQGTALRFATAVNMAGEAGLAATFDKITDVQYGFWHLRASDHCVFGVGSCGVGWEAAPAMAMLTGNGVAMMAVNAMKVKGHFALPAYLQAFAGIDTMRMSAQATAFGRRTRVACALPLAVSVCQLLDGGGVFKCPGGTPINRTFVNTNFYGPDAFGRVDMLGLWDPTEIFMRDYVRAGIYNHCDLDATATPPVKEYLNGDARMPAEARGNIQPVVDGLGGVAVEDHAHDPGRCMLGQTYVLPVVLPTGVNSAADCANICPAVPTPPAGCIPWPASDYQRVISFVNVTFNALNCWHQAGHPDGETWVQPKLTSLNCETAMDTNPHISPTLLATTCSGDNGMPFPYQAQISVEVSIRCDAPIGPPTNPANSLQPRLVQ